MTEFLVLFLVCVFVVSVAYPAGVRVGINRATNATPVLVKGCSHEALQYDCLLRVPDHEYNRRFRVNAFCVACGQGQVIDLPVHVIDGEQEGVSVARCIRAMKALGWGWHSEDQQFIRTNWT